MRGYLGPEGTFTHQALLKLDPQDCDAVPYATVPLAIDAVRRGDIDDALVPIENSVEGGVTATLDYISLPEDPLQITHEVVVDVSFNLYARPGTTLADVSSVISHPHAIAQVRHWLTDNLPTANISERGSTAEAAVTVADVNSGFDAAVCAPIAGQMNGLVALDTAIEDKKGASTRFVVVSRPTKVAPRTGHDKTSFVAYVRKNHPGALMEILQQLAVHGVNLCRIESRPTKTLLGDYCFSIDAEGHIDDARMGQALTGLRRVCQDVTFLGSYERADGKEPTIPHGGQDADYARAAHWLSVILSR